MMRGLAIAVSLMMILCLLPACGAGSGDKSAADMTPEEAIAAATQNLDSLESMSYDMDMDMGFTIAVPSMEINEKLDISSKSEADYIKSPIKMKMTMNMDMGTGEAMDVLVYLVQDGDTYITYTGMENDDGTVDWYRQEMTDLPDMSQYKAEDAMKLYLSSGEGFTENGSEEINGSEAVRYDGVIKGESMQEVMDSTGMTEQLAALNMGSGEDLFANAGDLPISIWIDKEQLLPVKYEMDMTEMMQYIMEKALAQELEGLVSTEEMQMTVSKVFVTMIVKNFNGVEDFEVPEEALEAELLDSSTAADMDPTE
jgi:outer membrane lipoprotein-sorting protein